MARRKVASVQYELETGYLSLCRQEPSVTSLCLHFLAWSQSLMLWLGDLQAGKVQPGKGKAPRLSLSFCPGRQLPPQVSHREQLAFVQLGCSQELFKDPSFLECPSLPRCLGSHSDLLLGPDGGHPLFASQELALLPCPVKFRTWWAMN